MIRSKLLERSFKTVFFNRTYSLQQHKSVFFKRWDEIGENIPDEIKNVTAKSFVLKPFHIIGSPKAIEVIQPDVEEILATLRASCHATSILPSTHLAVIQHLLHTENVESLLTILGDRLKYGVFLDDFTASFLMDYFLEQNKPLEASHIAVEYHKQTEIENDLVVALAMKSFFELSRLNDFGKEETPVAESTEEKKVRVKFLRNPIENKWDPKLGFKVVVGKAILDLSAQCNDEVKLNMQIVGHTLTNQYDECTDLLKGNSNQFYEDVLSLCVNLLQSATEKQELIDELSLLVKATQLKNFQEKLNKQVEEFVNKEQESLVADQEQKFERWSLELKESLQKSLEADLRTKSNETIKKDIEEIKLTKEKIWFFSEEEKHHMEIFNKRPSYPKRWFGKKKVPRIVDSSYIPPEIVKKSNTNAS